MLYCVEGGSSLVIGSVYKGIYNFWYEEEEERQNKKRIIMMAVKKNKINP